MISSYSLPPPILRPKKRTKQVPPPPPVHSQITFSIRFSSLKALEIDGVAESYEIATQTLKEKIFFHFFSKYPGKITVIGPIDKISPKKVAATVRIFKRVLDKKREKAPCGGIYTHGALTLCYKQM